jgi:endonuclease YncB( thermonuclease family)
MFGWRKRDEGFEWHRYVRTTIKVRRDARRDKAEQIKQQAVDGAKAAGIAAGVAARDGVKVAGAAARQGAKVAGAAAKDSAKVAGAAAREGAKVAGSAVRQGAQAAGEKARVVAKEGAVKLGVGARVAASALGRGWRAGSAGARRGAHVFGEKIAPPLRPVLDVVGRPSVAMPLAVAGSIAFVAGLLRIGLQHGMDRDSSAAILIGAFCLLLAFLPRLLLGTGPGMPAFFSRLHPHIQTGAKATGALIVLMAAVTMISPGRGALLGFPITTASLPFTSSKSVEGRGSALGPDTIRVGTTVVRLSGIEAPEREQRCVRPGNKRWRCGDAATATLQRLAGGRALKCTVGTADAAGVASGVCFDGETDINASYVKSGHAFAASGVFSRYGSAESEAKAAKAGLWAGDAERPSEWRAKQWDEAKRRAPDGCPIKGHVTGSTRAYVLPWSSDYERVRVNAARGGRWFCSEEEAVGAGWKPSVRG